MSLIQDSLRAILPSRRKLTTGGWESFNSPCCHHRGESQDRRRRGGVIFSREGFVMHCFNCGFKAGWQPGKLLSKNTKLLFKYLGLSDDEIKRLAFEAHKDQSDQQTQPTLNFTLHEESLPDDCLSIEQWAQMGCEDPELLAAVEYILNRGLSLSDWPWHWSSANGYRDRVIIPFYHEDKIVGWTGRKIGPGSPKYLSTSQSGYVFNLDHQTWNRKFVIVVEGQFDAIALDAAAIMTNSPNAVQCARLNALGKEIIVVPDRDAAGSKLLAAAIENNWSVSMPFWGEDVKDVADAVQRYGKVYTLTTILHYRDTNKIKIELARKKLEKLDAR